MAKIFIGTSGWSYPHWEEGIFYPPGLPRAKQLEFYSQMFNTVELNASFYYLPLSQTFKHWYQRTPKDFIFSVKASRYITHIKKLQGEGWRRFISRAKYLKEKLGPILFQLPPAQQNNPKRLKKFISPLPKTYRYVFEFRNNSWFCEEIYNILKKYNVGLCIADSCRFPLIEKLTADFVYIRFHGAKSLYSSKYSLAELKKWVSKINNWQKKGLDVYIYFNNDAQGFAIENARELTKMVA